MNKWFLFYDDILFCFSKNDFLKYHDYQHSAFLPEILQHHNADP